MIPCINTIIIPLIFLQKYFLKDFPKNGCICIKFPETTCDMDEKRKKAMNMTILEEIGENLVNCFSNNKMKLNTDKCHLLLNNQDPNTLKIGDLLINNSLNEKLLSITFDCKLKFNQHMEDICQSITEVKHTYKTCTMYGSNQKTLSYECVFQVTI